MEKYNIIGVDFQKVLKKGLFSKKIISFGIIVILLLAVLFIFVPLTISVYVNPGSVDPTIVTNGSIIVFDDVYLIIREGEAIPIDFLNFNIHNSENSEIVAYVKFDINGTKIAEYPSDKFIVKNITNISNIPYQPFGNYYGYDEQTGETITGFTHGYGYGVMGYPNITIEYKIEYKSHKIGTFYTNFSVNSTNYTYISNVSSEFTVENNPPVAIIDVQSTGYKDEIIEFNGSNSYDLDGEILSYYWTYTTVGIPTFPKVMGNDSIINYTWDNEGEFVVDLKVTDELGAESSDTSNIIINIENPPKADPGGPYSGYVNKDITFDGSGSSDNGSIISYYWEFGDGDTDAGQSCTHSYSSIGTYAVTLLVTDDSGSTRSNTTSAKIIQEPSDEGEEEDDEDIPLDLNNPPVAKTNGPYESYRDINISFDGSKSYDPDEENLLFEWDFGDGNTKNKEITNHSYQNSGNYTVTLTVTDERGKKDTDKTYAQITIKPNISPSRPMVSGARKGHQNISYSYSATSTDPDNDQIQYMFDWDDGIIYKTHFIQSGNSSIMNYSWSSPGIYKIKIKSIDEKNASSDILELTVLIDVKYVDEIGYLIDRDSDNIYDSFYCNHTGKEELMERKQGGYLLDSDGDGIGDFAFGLVSDSPVNQNKSQGIGITIYILVALAILIIIIGLIGRFGGKIGFLKNKKRK